MQKNEENEGKNGEKSPFQEGKENGSNLKIGEKMWNNIRITNLKLFKTLYSPCSHLPLITVFSSINVSSAIVSTPTSFNCFRCSSNSLINPPDMG